MKTQKDDRRVKYTKLFLKNSLVELMQEQPISKISVKALCDAADVNRSTFYVHYTDQYDLLRQLELEVIAEVEKHISKHALSKHTAQAVQVLDQILSYIASDAELFKVLLSDNGDFVFQKDIMQLAQQKIISDLRNDQTIEQRTSEYLQCFVITGALSIVQKWLHDGMPESTTEMAELISKLLYKGLSDFYA